MITIGWFASTARNLVLARASPAAGTPPKAGSSTPLYAPRAGCALSPFPIFTRSCSLTDGWPPGVGGGRFPAFPSRGQQNRPCACAASIRARSAATWLSICWRFHSRRPVRTKLTPALATSAQASLPSRVFPPSGGASDSPIGKTFRPSMTRHPVASIATTLIYGLGLAHGELGAFSGVSPSRDGAWLRKPVRRHVPPVARRSKRLWAEPAPRSTGRSPGSVCSTGTCPLVAPGTPKGGRAPTGHDHGRKHGAPLRPLLRPQKPPVCRHIPVGAQYRAPLGAVTSGSASSPTRCGNSEEGRPSRPGAQSGRRQGADCPLLAPQKRLICRHIPVGAQYRGPFLAQIPAALPTSPGGVRPSRKRASGVLHEESVFPPSPPIGGCAMKVPHVR